MNVFRTWAVTVRILRQFRRDRRTLALLFVMPLVLLGLIGYLMRGGGGHPDVGVVRLDLSEAATPVDKQLMGAPGIDARHLSLDDSRSQLRSGAIAAYVVIPDGFGQRLRRDHRITLEIHLEGTQPSVSAGVLGSLNAALGAAATAALPATAPRPDLRISYLHGGSGLDSLDYLGPAFIGLIVFMLVFVVTSVAFLRERSQGTLERLMASPLRRPEIVAGYMLGFAVVALVQSVLVLLFSLWVLRLHNEGNVLLVFLFEAFLALGAVNLGIFLSMFARTEFQAVQFIPLVIAPQVLLSGILFPIAQEPGPLQVISNLLPLTYAGYGMRDVLLKGATLADHGLQLDLAVGVLFAGLTAVLAGLTLRRRLD